MSPGRSTLDEHLLGRLQDVRVLGGEVTARRLHRRRGEQTCRHGETRAPPEEVPHGALLVGSQDLCECANAGNFVQEQAAGLSSRLQAEQSVAA